jgi:hypothetical protein
MFEKFTDCFNYNTRPEGIEFFTVYPLNENNEIIFEKVFKVSYLEYLQGTIPTLLVAQQLNPTRFVIMYNDNLYHIM